MAHPWKPDHYVIIDTDCGLDDFRLINLMLESQNIRVLAIITSNGVVNAKDGYLKVKNLLKSTHHEGILTGANLNTESLAIDCKVAKDFTWGNELTRDDSSIVLFTDVLNRVFKNCNEKIIFINLGSLNTISNYLKESPEYTGKIREVLWTCNFNMLKESYNYKADTNSYNSFIGLNIPLTITNAETIGKYNSVIIDDIKCMNTQLGNELYKSLSVPNTTFSGSFHDESVLLYLLKPELFTYSKSGNINNLKLLPVTDFNRILKDLFFTNSVSRTQVLSGISVDSSDYFQDVQAIMESTIKNYGNDEWSVCVLTSELHRHLGVYSIIGAKMGVRAREYFGAGVDELRIVSLAGLEPPFSCLNDGLQVSTGATLGQGLISVNENLKLPKAEFHYLNQKISITLKDEYRVKIADEIKELSFIYGLDSSVYWDLVRKIALRYWKDWSRYEIFDIEVQKN